MSVPVSDACAGLLDLFAAVSGERSDHGRDHPVAVVLALTAAATVAGMRGYTTMTGWVADVPADVLVGLYARVGADPVAGGPSKSTIWRVLTDADADAFDAVVGTWLTNLATTPTPAPVTAGGTDAEVKPVLMQVRLDGKTVRGAKDADGNPTHLLAALVGTTADRAVICRADRGRD